MWTWVQSPESMWKCEHGKHLTIALGGRDRWIPGVFWPATLPSWWAPGKWETASYLFFPVVRIKYHGKSNLKEKGFTLALSSRMSPSWQGGQDSQRLKQLSHQIHCQRTTTRVLVSFYMAQDTSPGNGSAHSGQSPAPVNLIKIIPQACSGKGHFLGESRLHQVHN